MRPSLSFRCLVGLLAIAPAAFSQVYPTSPDWTSADSSYATGAAVVDLDRDGWLDLVVSNGNDMGMEKVVVFYNQGNGVLPTMPDWQSTDTAYNGHLDVADVNGDGWLDVAVAGLGSDDNLEPMAKLYLNTNGVLSSTPNWQSSELGNAFGCAFGDVNNDGRPDLAVATGWAYPPENSYPNAVYLNVGGSLSATADWLSSDTDHLQGVLWVDADNDGWLDLVGIASSAQTRVYRNLGGMLMTVPSWTTTDAAGQDAIMGACGDVDADGFRDLMVTDNTQLGGSGRFRQYDGMSTGYFATVYGWSYSEGYGSAVALGDVDADGDLDLATGAWWDAIRLFLNTGTGLPASPSWSSTTSSGTTVAEKIVLADVDNAAVRATTETFPADGRRLVYLSRQPIREVTAVRRDGVALAPSAFTYGRDTDWVTVAQAAATSLEVDYTYSLSLDMVVTNWDPTGGSYLFYNRLEPALETDLVAHNASSECFYLPGTTIHLELLISNVGPVAVTGATVADTFPAALTGVTWTCLASPGSSCSASGSGNLAHSVDLAAGPADSWVLFEVTATVASGATGSVVNSVTVTPPAAVTDPVPGNNTATHLDWLEPPLFCDSFDSGDTTGWTSAAP